MVEEQSLRRKNKIYHFIWYTFYLSSKNDIIMNIHYLIIQHYNRETADQMVNGSAMDIKFYNLIISSSISRPYFDNLHEE